MISIILPFYNERENLNELWFRLLKVTTALQVKNEIIFVNDGSTDGGGESLKSLISSRENVRLIELDRNYGLSAALYAGFEAAKGDTLVCLDTDLQNPPEEIPRLLTLLKDIDMVTGIRRPRQDPWLKRTSSIIANRIRRAVLKDRIEDVGCSLRVFKRPVLQAFLPYQGIHRFFPVLAETQGFKVLQVPVEHRKRLHGRSKYGLRNRLIGPLWDLVTIRWIMAKKIRYRIRSDSL